MRRSEISVRERNLPHWEREGGTYFITFRLHGSIPEHIMEEARRAAERIMEPLARKQHLRRTLERYLDDASPDYRLLPNECAAVAEAIHSGIGNRYRLHAWCVMPNHVHAVATLFPSSSLTQILHSWKSFSANRIHKLGRLTGPIWQREYFDRLLRTNDELASAIRYTLHNPIAAKLNNWPWIGSES